MLKNFLKDESGQDIVEYSLLLVLVGAAAVLVLTGMGQSISNIFNNIKNKISEVETKTGGSTGGTTGSSN